MSQPAILADVAAGVLVTGVRRSRQGSSGRRPGGNTEGPADATLLFPHVDEKADLLTVAVGRSAPGTAPTGLAVGGLQVLSLSDFAPRAELQMEPLAPHFPLVA